MAGIHVPLQEPVVEKRDCEENSIAIWAKTDDMTKNISLKTLVVAMLALDVAVHRGA